MLTAISLILISTHSYAQIDKTLSKVTWRVNKEKVIYGNTILREEGRNNIRGMTNVGYQTYEQFKADIITQAEREMWSTEKKESTLNSYKEFAKGGFFHLYLTRLTIDAANLDMFTIIIKDETGKEVLRKELKSNVPQVPASGTDYWWNYTSLSISKELKGKYSIYVVDKLGHDNNKVFKFEIII